MEKTTVYEFMAEAADRRTKEYKELEKELDLLVCKYGKESEQVKSFFDRKI